MFGGAHRFLIFGNIFKQAQFGPQYNTTQYNTTQHYAPLRRWRQT